MKIYFLLNVEQKLGFSNVNGTSKYALSVNIYENKPIIWDHKVSTFLFVIAIIMLYLSKFVKELIPCFSLS